MKALLVALFLVGCLMYVGWVSDNGYHAKGDVVRVIR